MNCDPQSLITAASCYRCIAKGMLPEVQIYLLCQWAQAPCGIPTDYVVLTSAGYPGVNQTYHKINGVQWKGLTDPTIILQLIGSVWNITPLDADEQYDCSMVEFPCLWHVADTGTAPAPKAHYLSVT